MRLDEATRLPDAAKMERGQVQARFEDTEPFDTLFTSVPWEDIREEGVRRFYIRRTGVNTSIVSPGKGPGDQSRNRLIEAGHISIRRKG